MALSDALKRLMAGEELSEGQVTESVDEMVSDVATPTQIAAFLVALRNKGESPGEIAAFAAALRRHSVKIHPRVEGRLVDTCGTGGDGSGTFNVSTVAAIVSAGAGLHVAKHGNRSVSSRCGSADLLESLGFRIEQDPNKVKESIEQLGFGFMFAPAFHPAMKKVASIRRELGIRTIFNVMGPLLNPAGASAQLLGVYSPELVDQIANVLLLLGTTEEAMVVHAADGMDEISVTGKTRISWLKDGVVTTRDYSPKELGVSQMREDSSIRAENVDESARAAVKVLSGYIPGSCAEELVLANASSALVVAGRASGFEEAVEMARESIRSGAAWKKLEECVKFSGGDLSRIEVFATGA
jgi:anthranilate phosphoribosyltransferase